MALKIKVVVFLLTFVFFTGYGVYMFLCMHPCHMDFIGKDKKEVLELLSERSKVDVGDLKQRFHVGVGNYNFYFKTVAEALQNEDLKKSDVWIVNKVQGRLPFIYNLQKLHFKKDIVERQENKIENYSFML